MKTHLIISDPHAHPSRDNSRADWVGQLIADVKPDVVVNIGDMFDLPSLSGYDKGKASFHGRNYKADIEAGREFDERLWAPIRRAKRRLPFRVFCVGNHENRLERVLEYQPELAGALSFDDFDLPKNYDAVVGYTGQTPGAITIDGITYAHYSITGVSGRPIDGEHAGYTLLTKKFHSITVGHSHKFDYCVRPTEDGRRLHGLVCGTLQDYVPDWAGREIFSLWSHGVAIKRDVSGGDYDLEWVSLLRLKKEYEGKT